MDLLVKDISVGDILPLKIGNISRLIIILEINYLEMTQNQTKPTIQIKYLKLQNKNIEICEIFSLGYLIFVGQGFIIPATSKNQQYESI